MTTTRKKVIPNDVHRPLDGYPALLSNDVVPDKLILRSGHDISDLYALVDLTTYIGHGHSDAGNFTLLTSNGSVLL